MARANSCWREALCPPLTREVPPQAAEGLTYQQILQQLHKDRHLSEPSATLRAALLPFAKGGHKGEAARVFCGSAVGLEKCVLTAAASTDEFVDFAAAAQPLNPPPRCARPSSLSQREDIRMRQHGCFAASVAIVLQPLFVFKSTLHLSKISVIL